MRALFGVDGVCMAGKPMGTEDGEQAILLTLFYQEMEEKLLFRRATIYVAAFTVGGNWKVPMDSDFSIEGSEIVNFTMGYAGGRRELGLTPIRQAFMAMRSAARPRDWEGPYLKYAYCFAEPVRFPPIHILAMNSRLDDTHCCVQEDVESFEFWCINEWDTLSTIWKILALYGVWDPLDNIPMRYKEEGCILRDEISGRCAIAVLTYAPLDKATTDAVEEKGYQPLRR